MKIIILLMAFITIFTSAKLKAAPSAIDGNCSIGIKEDENKDKRFIASYVNYFESENLIVFRINDKIKSIAVSPAVKWEFPADSSVKNLDQLKKNQGSCIAIDYVIQNGKKSAGKIKLLSDYRINKNWTVKYEELENLITNKAVIIDSRPEDIYAMGSIPGAKNIPLAKLRDDSGKKLLPEDKNVQLVFYCSGPSCRVSSESASIANKAGYKNVKVYAGGYPDYLKNNNIISIHSAYLQTLQEKKEALILIDIRKNPSEEHIPGAFHADTAKIDDLKAQLPQKSEDKINALIIVYSSGEEETNSIDTAKKINSWGYKNISVLNGGFKSYVKSGVTEKKNLLKKIEYKPKESFFLNTDQLYSGLIKNEYKDYIFIDIRDEKDIIDEPAVSALGALKIPFSKLDSNQPKSKYAKYLIYSDSAEKASEARELLIMENFKNIQVIKGFIFSDGKGGLLIGEKKLDSDQLVKLKR